MKQNWTINLKHLMMKSNEKNIKILEDQLNDQKNLNKYFGGNLQDEKKRFIQIS